MSRKWVASQIKMRYPCAMPVIFDAPLTAPTQATAMGVDGVSGTAQTITEHAAGVLTHRWAIYVGAAILALLFARAVLRRIRRDRAAPFDKAAITRADRAITRITGLAATAVLALGMWDFFGDVFHMHPLVRVTLFAFIEMQIVAAFRRARRHLNRHGHLGHAILTVYGLAFASASIAAVHADTLDLAMFRLFVAGIAAYMLAEELAEERDILRTGNPAKYATSVRARAKRPINWALTPERVLVWLRLAEPTERQVEQVERQRRLARFARTAHRLHTLKEAGSPQWRIRRAARSLRRQAEAANEHLSLATDRDEMDRVRAHLAFLYQVEVGTSRAAVSDLSPWGRRRATLAISATPHVPPLLGQDDTPSQATADASGHADRDATAPATRAATESATNRPPTRAAKTAPRPVRRPATTVETEAPLAAKRLAKWVAKYPTATNAELAKRADMSERSVSRHLATARAINAAKEGGDEDAKERTHVTPFRHPRELVGAGAVARSADLNGHQFLTEETS